MILTVAQRNVFGAEAPPGNNALPDRAANRSPHAQQRFDQLQLLSRRLDADLPLQSLVEVPPGTGQVSQLDGHSPQRDQHLMVVRDGDVTVKRR